MRVGVDVRKLGDGGIGEYIRETLTAALELAPDLEIVAFGMPGREGLLAHDRVEWVPVDAGKYSIAEHWRLPAAARGRGLDLFHAPHYVLPLGLRGPAVVTIHDIIHVLHPRSWKHAAYGRLAIGWAVARATRVISVSESTAADLRDSFGAKPDKVVVIPNGVSPRFHPLPEAEVDAALASLGIARPYVLCVANWLPHKNVETLVHAWAKLADPKPDLVLCGAGYDDASSFWQGVEVGVDRSRIHSIGTIVDDLLVALYCGAEVLASASLHEGFCLPVVEAFACGTPVVAPRAGAVPEVAGDAAELVMPHCVDSVSDGLYRVLSDSAARRRMVERGFERAAQFRWRRAAEKTIEVYRSTSRSG